VTAHVLALVDVAYRHSGGSGLGHLFGFVAAVSVALRFGRFFMVNPWYACAFLVLGWLVYRFFTRGRRSRRA
jgi:Flp pilus assembly protein TadB